jgi:hypothetical protein
MKDELKHLAHQEAHPFEKPGYSYMNKRQHMFPWEHQPCSLFDEPCKKKLAAGEAV